MYQKITAQTVSEIKKGDILVMYPTSGEPVEEVDVKGTHNNAVLQVTNITGDTFALMLEGSTVPAILNAGVGPIRRKKSVLVEEKNWWLYKHQISN